jgi:hypothetical protein
MQPSPAQMDKIRSYAADLVLGNVPFCRDCSDSNKADHRKHYEDIVEKTGWKWSKGAQGTTCGFLCHWLLWQIGVTNKDVVNWTDTTRGTKFDGGSGSISKLWAGGQKANAFVQIIAPAINVLEQTNGQTGPRAGDVILIQQFDSTGYVSNSDHVFVFLGKDVTEARIAARKADIVSSQTPAGAKGNPLIWVTAEAGQGPVGFATDAILKTRAVRLTGKARSKTPIEDTQWKQRAGVERVIVGWLSLDKLDYDAKAVTTITARTTAAP